MPTHDSLYALCGSIQKISRNIQSVAIINKMGRMVENSSTPEFSEKFPDHMNEHLLMQCVLQISMGRDFDEFYGPINYHISERASLTFLTFPVEDNVILVTCNKNVSPIGLAKKIVHAISEHMKQVSVIEL